MSKHDILSQFDSLPPDAQREVMDFIAFLRERHGPAHAIGKRKPRALSKQQFVGMWRGREDLKDSAEWVRTQQQREWMRGGD